ncbi:YcjX family protein [Kangiella sp. HD9-110m-PIT-SAG07]|nr:YcjX family protein [Kangiella sp. HD9-110m-PIT-SAG07]
MDWINKARIKSSDLIERSLDRNIRIAVTGLSGAGKTAFITSLINQLLFASNEKHLTFFRANSQRRIKACKLMQHDELHIPSFDYNAAINHLTAEEPEWPMSTKTVTQAQLKSRFTVANRWLRKVQSDSHVTIDVIDYPGEWLLDLPLLSMDYKEWSQSCCKYLSSERRHKYTNEVFQHISTLDHQTRKDELEISNKLSKLAKEYASSLLEYRKDYNDYATVLPGRFILPGDLAGAPVLDFFPILNQDILNLDWSQFDSNSTLAILEKRFNYYKNKIIKPFFHDYFSNVDRQIVLIDTGSALEAGYESYQDLKETIEQLLEGFSYGRSNWLKRLFSPTIDKLMIATSKADLVPPDQHAALESFMQKMVNQAKNNVDYEGVEVETMAISAIATSEPISTEHQGKRLLCVKGIEQSSGESVIHYPGKVPSRTLSREEWNELNIDFSPFAIPPLSPDEPLPHIRMDKVIEFLIGDKFI